MLSPRIGRREFLGASARAALTAAVLGGGASALAVACQSNSAGGPSTASSDQLFGEGRFADADKGYAELLARNPNDAHALAQRGYVALLSNRLAQAQDFLRRSLEVDAQARSQQLLALALYRADDFTQAAPLYARTGAPARAQLLESFKGRTPYDIQGPATSRLPFLQTDPLPLIEAAVNGLEPVPFHIDTGGTLALSPDLARRAGVPQFGTQPSVYAGGRSGSPQVARVDSLTLGGFQVRNLPATVMGVVTGRAAPDGRPIGGLVGTTVLSRFLSTLDYPGAALVLRRKTPALLEEFQAQARAASAAVIPFWMHDDHLMVAWGTVNGHGPWLFTVDTGGANLGFTAPDRTLEEAGVRVDRSQSRQGVGGGGAFTAHPIQVSEVTLGSVVRRNLRGSAGAFPGRSPGFTIGGLVSHLFFRPSTLTIDAVGMRLFVAGGAAAS